MAANQGELKGDGGGGKAGNRGDWGGAVGVCFPSPFAGGGNRQLEIEVLIIDVFGRQISWVYERGCALKFPDPRDSEVLKVRGGVVDFSFWPIKTNGGREKMISTMFSNDPWFLIKYEIDQLASDDVRVQAESFRVQARDFFLAAEKSDTAAAKPLLIYYSFLNLVKCLKVIKTKSVITSAIMHGMKEKLPVTPGAFHGVLGYDPNASNSALQLLANTINAKIAPSVTGPSYVNVRTQDLLSQIIVGHRIYCAGEGINERFIPVEDINYTVNEIKKEVSINIKISRASIAKRGMAITEVKKSLSRDRDWRTVKCTDESSDRNICFELMHSYGYKQRPSQELHNFLGCVRNSLWRVVNSNKPYIRYYVYVNDSPNVVNQMASVYMSIYYFSSISRYKPQEFGNILDSKIGPFVNEFFNTQPYQFLYMIASEAMAQEVSRGAFI